MNINLKLSAEDVDLVLMGLGELPAKRSLGLILHIQQTGREQIAQQKAEADKAAAEEKPDGNDLDHDK